MYAHVVQVLKVPYANTVVKMVNSELVVPKNVHAMKKIVLAVT